MNMLHRAAASFLLLCSLAVAGCQKTVSSDAPAGPAAYEAIAVSAAEAYPPSYVLQPGDRIDIRVFREEEFSTQNILVDASGNIALPLVGEVRAAGVSPATLSDQVTQMLGRRYLRDPQVTVTLREAIARTVSVEGDVEQPGVYEIRPNYTLLSAIALAQSPSETAKLDEILIFRDIDGRRAAGRFDLAQIRAGKAADPQVLPGDVIVVGLSRTRQAYQDILRAAPLFNVFTFL
ncbi:polysaccharide biosynthesis/export family protein [Croceicoccus sp. YJ47]|uniref:polysaccharide biosynthesis/export family protein n=1 Tax=Croceicoccus sp. YJ47 TaxID=2798724 RepID=UPI001924C6DD|nr:polysaccharide biosynthesis/export family protein [Croceicoccus sp. YJ47]QQN72982.1 polysaccharide export protein [Croceicoccus sp. YJ47]